MTVMPPNDGAPQVTATGVDAPLSLEQMQAEVYRVNVDNGWFQDTRSFGDDVALLHTEVSEMYEAYRDHGLDDATQSVEAPAPAAAESAETFAQVPLLGGSPLPNGLPPVPVKLPKPEGVASEVADVFIRLLDTCQRHGIDLRAEYTRKVAYNKTRGFMHGGKRI